MPSSPCLLFCRYDLDRSGTINSIDELKMLTVNLCFKVGLNLSQDDLNRFVSELTTEQVHAGTFVPLLCSRCNKPPVQTHSLSLALPILQEEFAMGKQEYTDWFERIIYTHCKGIPGGVLSPSNMV